MKISLFLACNTVKTLLKRPCSINDIDISVLEECLKWRVLRILQIKGLEKKIIAKNCAIAWK